MDHANIVDLRGLAGSSTLAVFARMPAKHGNLQVPTPQQDRQRERGPSIDGSTKEHHRGRMGSPVRLELPRRREKYEEGVATVLCPLLSLRRWLPLRLPSTFAAVPFFFALYLP